MLNGEKRYQQRAKKIIISRSMIVSALFVKNNKMGIEPLVFRKVFATLQSRELLSPDY